MYYTCNVWGDFCIGFSADTVPEYVAAYLASCPRDPLAAEESSRKASTRVNEAAPRKVMFLCLMFGACFL